VRRDRIVKVLYVDHTSLVSGSQRALLDLLAALPHEVDPIVVCPEGHFAELVRELGVPVLRFAGTSGSLRLHPTQSIKALREIGRAARTLRRMTRETRADLVHANSLRAGLMAGFGSTRGRPPMVLHVHDALPAGLSTGLVRRFLRGRSSAVVTISDYTSENFFGPADKHRAKMLQNPLDVHRFDPADLSRDAARAQLGLDPNEFVLGLVAQITPWKGQEEAIRAIGILRSLGCDARLLLVGEVKFADRSTRYDNLAYERDLRALIQEQGLRERVWFWGERDDIPVIMRALDALVAPSWEEPFGRSVIEAMALETPVVATNVGGPAEYIEDGVDGLLIPPRDASALADAAGRLLSDRAAARRMGERASPKVRTLFDRTEYAKKMVDVYRDILGAA
jgi:glycosyltransferase involved in cell wall biosynthesis